jgi:hypothetical protein
LLLPLLWCIFSNNAPLLCVSFQFLVHWFCVCVCAREVGSQPDQGAMLVYPRGGCGSTTCHLVLNCWSAECLPSRFGDSVWRCGSPPVFSVLHGIEKLSMGEGFRVSNFWFSFLLYFC